MPLSRQILAYGNQDSECLLSEMVTKDGSWNLDLFRVWLSPDMVQLIKGILPPLPFVGLDKIACSLTSSGSFLIKIAYIVLREGD